MTTEVVIRALQGSEKKHRKAFDCGNADLNHYFRQYAWTNRNKPTGTHWVAINSEGFPLGFVVFAIGSVERAELPTDANYPDYPLPILRLARLAVDKTAKGMGIGGKLMKRIFQQAVKLIEQGGCVGVVVDAKPESISYYERYGFKPFTTVVSGATPETTPMFLDIRYIQDAMKPESEDSSASEEASEGT